MTRKLLTSVYAAGLFVFAGAGCTSDSPRDGEASAKAADVPKPEASAASTPKKLLHCGDFITVAELTALGLDASSFNPGQEQNSPGGPILCNCAGYGFTLFDGGAYSSIVGGSKESIAK